MSHSHWAPPIIMPALFGHSPTIVHCFPGESQMHMCLRVRPTEHRGTFEERCICCPVREGQHQKCLWGNVVHLGNWQIRFYGGIDIKVDKAVDKGAGTKMYHSIYNMSCHRSKQTFFWFT